VKNGFWVLFWNLENLACGACLSAAMRRALIGQAGRRPLMAARTGIKSSAFNHAPLSGSHLSSGKKSPRRHLFPHRLPQLAAPPRASRSPVTYFVFRFPHATPCRQRAAPTRVAYLPRVPLEARRSIAPRLPRELVRTDAISAGRNHRCRSPLPQCRSSAPPSRWRRDTVTHVVQERRA
jgi:hypothetical protein